MLKLIKLKKSQTLIIVYMGKLLKHRKSFFYFLQCTRKVDGLTKYFSIHNLIYSEMHASREKNHTSSYKYFFGVGRKLKKQKNNNFHHSVNSKAPKTQQKHKISSLCKC